MLTDADRCGEAIEKQITAEKTLSPVDFRMRGEERKEGSERQSVSQTLKHTHTHLHTHLHTYGLA